MTSRPTHRGPAWLPFAVVGAAVAAFIVLVAILPKDQPSRVETPRETFTLTGKVVVPARVETFVPDGGCIGARGYTDIQPGAGVAVYSASGTVVAHGELAAGRMDSLRCAYAFTVTS